MSRHNRGIKRPLFQVNHHSFAEIMARNAFVLDTDRALVSFLTVPDKLAVHIEVIVARKVDTIPSQHHSHDTTNTDAGDVSPVIIQVPGLLLTFYRHPASIGKIIDKFQICKEIEGYIVSIVHNILYLLTIRQECRRIQVLKYFILRLLTSDVACFRSKSFFLRITTILWLFTSNLTLFNHFRKIITTNQ